MRWRCKALCWNWETCTGTFARLQRRAASAASHDVTIILRSICTYLESTATFGSTDYNERIFVVTGLYNLRISEYFFSDYSYLQGIYWTFHLQNVYNMYLEAGGCLCTLNWEGREMIMTYFKALFWNTSKPERSSWELKTTSSLTSWEFHSVTFRIPFCFDFD
jgi:hypothetical protein